jgi:hypothetical protein
VVAEELAEDNSSLEREHRSLFAAFKAHAAEDIGLRVATTAGFTVHGQSTTLECGGASALYFGKNRL